MLPVLRIFKRTLSTEKNDIGRIFIKENVQKLLIDITRFNEEQIFASRPVPSKQSPQLIFMTDDQLQKAKQDAYENVKARMQMPPVLSPDTSKPKVLSHDPELVGYMQSKVMFIDVGPGYTNKTRLMSVREADGTLRYPSHEERSRLNHMFYPSEEKSIDSPKMFEKDNLFRLLKKKEYRYILDRACVQFEPDDPRYFSITSQVYDYINDKMDHDRLRSTRHFGPMSIYLAYHKNADDLIIEMLGKNLIDDAAKVVELYDTCHNVGFKNGLEPLDLIRAYADDYSNKKYNLDIALRFHESKRTCGEPEDQNTKPRG